MSVDFARDDERPHVGTLTVDFDRLNLVRTDRIETVADAVRSVPADVSVLVLRGGADGLTAGLDLDWAKDRTAHEGYALLASLYELIEAVRELDAVTVCDCRGYALGAGFELALACDFRVATEEAALGLPEVNVGLPTVIQGGLLLRLVGLATAKELIYLGRTVSGERAAELDLVHAVAPESDYDGAVAGLVDELAAKSPLVLSWQKRVFREWRSVGLESGMASSVGLGAQCFGTHDQREAMAAFLESRDPAFEGR